MRYTTVVRGRDAQHCLAQAHAAAHAYFGDAGYVLTQLDAQDAIKVAESEGTLLYSCEITASSLEADTPPA